MKEPVTNQECKFSDNGVTIYFEWSEYKNYGITLIVKNETKERIYIEWSNARIEDEPICFGNDNSFTYLNSKPDEVIHAGSTCERFITRQSEFETEGREFFYLSYLKKYNTAGSRSVIIPIKRGSDTKDYRFMLGVVGE